MEKGITYKKSKARARRRVAIRKHLAGSSERPRLSIFRSLNHIYAQIIDDVEGKTLISISTMSKDLREELAQIKEDPAQENSDKKKKKQKRLGRKVKQSYQVGLKLGEKALAAGITRIAFDRGGYKYHGRVKALADGARKAGLEF
jgi:large subunit ribosomal protein L18